jgi:kinesin family protein C2/C3
VKHVGLSVETSFLIVEPSSPISRHDLSSISRHAGHNFHEVFHLRQGIYSDKPISKILEMTKSTNLDVSGI